MWVLGQRAPLGFWEMRPRDLETAKFTSPQVDDFLNLCAKVHLPPNTKEQVK